MESAIMKKKRDLTDREQQLKIDKAREIARQHRISSDMMVTKGQRPKVSLPRFSWDKEKE